MTKIERLRDYMSLPTTPVEKEVLELLDLVELQHEALKHAVADPDISFGPTYEGEKERIDKARKMFKKWNKP